MRNPTLNPLVGGVKNALISDSRQRETHASSKCRDFLEGEPAFRTIIEIRECGKWRVHDEVKEAVTRILDGVPDGGEELAPCSSRNGMFESAAPDTGSTGSSSSCVEVQRPGVSKVPAHLFSKLHSGATYLLCFDGGVTWAKWGHGAEEAGAGSCLFHVQTDGRRNKHLQQFDQTVYLTSRTTTIDQAEYVGLLAGVMGFESAVGDRLLHPVPGMLLIDGDNGCVIQDVQSSLQQHGTAPHDPLLGPIASLIEKTLRKCMESGIKVHLRIRPRRFNKVADQLARRARQQRESSFEHELVHELDRKFVQH